VHDQRDLVSNLFFACTLIDFSEDISAFVDLSVPGELSGCLLELGHCNSQVEGDLPRAFRHEWHQTSENNGRYASKSNHVSPAVRNVCESCSDSVADDLAWKLSVKFPLEAESFLTAGDGHVVQTNESTSHFGGRNLGNVEWNDHGC